MGCPSCGAENPLGARFCNNCGAPQAAVCPGCGNGNPPASRFCNACADPLAAPAPTGPEATASPQSYTPRHLAEKILANRAGLEGERKQVTVLFADVVGSTELIRGRDPEEAQALLDGVTRVMMDAVHRYEGTVSRLMGDGLMALFGAPIAHEDHAVRACYAALAMQDAVRRHAERVRRETGAVLTIRAGLSAGEVVVRAIRDDLHMDFTAMGQTVHLAARMEQLAKPDTTALTPETLALVEGYVQVRSLGLLPVKGLPKPIEVFELLGAEQARTRLQATAGRGLTRFVGRDVEMAALHAALERARSGQGQVAALVGEPGVGKSRLVWELTHSHRTDGWLVLESGSVSYGKATSYLPVIDLLKAYCRIEARDDPRAVREKLTGKLLALDEGLRSALPPLLELLDVPSGDPAWETLDPRQRRLATLDALKRLLLRESQEQPLLLVFEDLHWIDAEAQTLLDSLVESLPAARIFLLVNYRPEYTHAWTNKTYYTQLRIDPLSPESADELLDGLLGSDPSVESLKSLLIERTEGNPFFLEESVRALVETGALTGERGAYRLVGSVRDVRIPATVQAILAARIDRLPPEEKHLLQVAAVIGKDVPDAILWAVADRSEDDLRRGLAELQGSEFLYPTRLFPELEYTFKHALTHEVVYVSLLQERRKTLHARIVGALEDLGGDRLVEVVDQLAHHAYRGEQWESAARYSRQAGHRATARGSNQGAADAFERALDALESLPADRASQEAIVDVLLELRPSLTRLGDDQGALRRLREAHELAERLDDRNRQARVASQLCFLYLVLGEIDLAEEAAQRALAGGEALRDVGIQIVACHRLAQIHANRGELRQAAALDRRALSLLAGRPTDEHFDMATPPVLEARVGLAGSLTHLGELTEAATVAAEAVAMAESRGVDPWSGSMAFIARSMVGIVSGEPETTIPMLERGHTLTMSGGAHRQNRSDFFLSMLALAYARGGQLDKATASLAEAVEIAVQAGDKGNFAAFLATFRSQAGLLIGQLDDAQAEASGALALARRRKSRGYEAEALRCLGDVAARREPPERVEAEAYFREALMLAEELGMRPLQAHCHLGLGKLYRRTGRLDAARAELATAVAMLGEMGMAFWLPEAERELAESSR